MSTMKIISNPAAKAVAHLARPAASSSCRVLTAVNHHVQTLSYHSTSAADSQTLRRGADLPTSSALSSLGDLELDPRNWGYRVVVATTTLNSRGYTTSSISSLSTSSHEDYDAYTLHVTPSEGTQCDLGVLGEPCDSDAALQFNDVLQFDDAGFVRPVWETSGHDSSSSDEGWTWNSEIVEDSLDHAEDSVEEDEEIYQTSN